MDRVLFVCMGNICRSPVAAAVFKKTVADRGAAERIDVDSAGTYGYHVGEGADDRAASSAARRGYDLTLHRARKVISDDFDRFDYVIAMDRDNYEELLAIAPSGSEGRIALFMQYAPHLGSDEVPDPYYGGPSGFEHVLDLCEAASISLLDHLLGKAPGSR